jgi:hypothetical protein
MACINNNVKLAKWIYDNNPNIIYVKDTGYHNINCNLLNKKKFIQNFLHLQDSQDFSDSQDSLDSLDYSHSSDSSDINLIDYNFENPLTEALEKGNLQIIVWLVQIIPKLYISKIYTNYLLILYAQQNFIDMAKWLLNYNANKIKFIKFNYILENSLIKGHLDFYYFIIESFPNINLNLSEQNINILIQNIIINNTTNIIELINILIHKNSLIINIMDFNKLLLITCTNSTLVILEYLMSLKSNIDLTFNNYQLFKYACYSKNLNIAKWLLNKYPDFNITYNNHELFSKCCFIKLSNNNNKDFFDWFCSINPDLYNVKYDDMNNITDFYIFNNNLKLEIKNCSELLSFDNYEDIDNYKYIDILKIPLINNDALLENNDALLENNDALLENNDALLENNDKLSSIIKSFIENYDL